MLLPGMDGTGLLLEPFVAALGQEFNVQVMRYPTDVPLDYAELEALCRAALPREEPFILLGESFSGPIAVALAATHSPQLKGLILSCTFVRNPRPIFAPLRTLVGLLPVSLAPMRVLCHLLLGRFSNPGLRALLEQAITQVSPAALRARLRAVLSVDVSVKLAAVKVPSLYLRATHDQVVPPSASALIAKLSPHTQIVEMDGPHCLLQTNPSGAAQIVAAFIRQVQYLQGENP